MSHIKPLIFFLLLANSLCFQGQNQNTYFSKFHYSPFTLNPALTGLSFNGSFRFLTNYRYEYGVSNYETHESSLDVMIPTRKHTFGAGVQLIRDFYSNNMFVINKIGTLGSYHFILDRYGKQNLSVGAYLSAYTQVDRSNDAILDTVQVGNIELIQIINAQAHLNKSKIHVIAF